MSNSHTDEKLVRMANQIATFFVSQPEMTRVDGVAAHINKFWEPRMRKRFLEIVEGGGEGLNALVLQAAGRIRPPSEPSVK